MLYGVHLSYRSRSPNTAREEMRNVAKLYAWAGKNGIDLDTALLRGRGLSARDIRAFVGDFMASRRAAGVLHPRESDCHVIWSCKALCCWFIGQFALSQAGERRAIEVELLVSAQKRDWDAHTPLFSPNTIAPDLTDAEIDTIENYLRPATCLSGTKAALSHRDYLMWRLVIEFGLRIGEVLALRLCDAPSKDRPYLSVVRVEEREGLEIDPRGAYAPRPKTLSRDLGQLVGNSVLPGALLDYVSCYRFRQERVHGRTRKKFSLGHTFLIVSKYGEPLSMRGAQDVAQRIQRDTGVNFHWHVGRHALFNRGYSVISNMEDGPVKQVRLEDLVYYGGWRSSRSLRIYTARTRRDNARGALRRWQRDQ